MRAAGPRYAICITNYNSGGTIREAMDSVVRQFPPSLVEILVTDNESTDDSLPYLRHLLAAGEIQGLRVERSSRGKGRQLAFEMSHAPYILANIDMDVVYKPNILNVVDAYHRAFEGKVLSVYGMMVVPRQVAESIGGWRDLDRHEDTDLAVRAFERGLHIVDPSVSVVQAHLKQRQSFMHRWGEARVGYRDWFRIGMRPHDLPASSFIHPSILWSYILYRTSVCYENPMFSQFFREWKAAWSHARRMSEPGRTHGRT